MAETKTPVLNFIKPEIGGSNASWGNRTNENWDKSDAAYLADHNALLSTVQTGANSGTIVEKDAGGTVIATYNLADEEPFRVMKDLLLYDGDMIDAPLTDIPANRPGAMVPQVWVKAFMDMVFPVGTIIVWYGDETDIPDGWALCDGIQTYIVDGVSYTTPNLMGRVVLPADPASTSYQPKMVNGTPGNFGHTHTISITGWALTAAQIPPHVHGHAGAGSRNVLGRVTSGGAYNAISASGGLFASVPLTDGSDLGVGGPDHVHAATHTHAATSTNDNAAPPYIALCYIMKVRRWETYVPP